MRAFLALVMALFLGILAYVWWGARAADPVILDEHGHPRAVSH